jgi:hypothetical protein
MRCPASSTVCRQACSTAGAGTPSISSLLMAAVTAVTAVIAVASWQLVIYLWGRGATETVAKGRYVMAT